MKELSLFTGSGGGVLGSKLLGWEAVGYVEWDKYCQEVLAKRIEDGFLDEAPIFGDIDEFIKSGASKKYQGFVDVVTAGFPCQGHSVAGKRLGKEDPRNKWPQTLAVIRDLRPGLRYALLENVPGLLSVNGGAMFAQILADLAEAGFDARWCVLGADDVGAPHRRKRLWILAYAHGERQLQPKGFEQNKRGWFGDSSEDVADSDSGSRSEGQSRRASGELPPESEGLRGRSGQGQTRQVTRSSGEDVADSDSPTLSKRWRPESMETEHSPSECGSQGQSTSYWSTEPDVGRVAHGVASRVDRLKALGNGQVPLVAATAWLLLTK